MHGRGPGEAAEPVAVHYKALHCHIEVDVVIAAVNDPKRSDPLGNRVGMAGIVDMRELAFSGQQVAVKGERIRILAGHVVCPYNVSLRVDTSGIGVSRFGIIDGDEVAVAQHETVANAITTGVKADDITSVVDALGLCKYCAGNINRAQNIPTLTFILTASCCGSLPWHTEDR